MENASMSLCAVWHGVGDFAKERFEYCVVVLMNMFLRWNQVPSGILTMVISNVNDTIAFCDKIRTENSTPDYLQCRKDTGMALGYCSLAFNETESQNFWSCFHTVKDFQTLNPDTTITKWKFYELFCKEDESNSVCGAYFAIRDILYSIDTRFLDNEDKAFYYTYILPSFGFITIVLNGFILFILSAQMSTNGNVFFLRIKTICDTLTVVPQLPVVLYFITFQGYTDFLPYMICIVINLCMVILPAMFHTISMFASIGIAFQKYFIVTFPLKVQTYLKLKYVYIYMTVCFIISLSIFTPTFIVICNMNSIKVQSKIFYDLNVTTMTVELPDDSSEWMKLLDEFGVVLRTLILQCLPCFFLLLLEIAGIRRSKAYIKQAQHLQATSQPTSSKNSNLTQVVYMSIANVSIFIVAELPNAVAFLYYSIVDFSYRKQMEDFDTLSIILNSVTWLSFTSNLFVCIAFCTDFRKKFVNLIRCSKS